MERLEFLLKISLGFVLLEKRRVFCTNLTLTFATSD